MKMFLLIDPPTVTTQMSKVTVNHKKPVFYKPDKVKKAKKRTHKVFSSFCTKCTFRRRWRKIREEYKSEHPLCELCLKAVRYVPMDEVHHIIPVRAGGTNDKNNLMSLCHSCHQKIHIALGDRYRPGE